MSLPASGSASAPAGTSRSKAKSDRRDKLIAAAERLVAERGFLAVRLEDIGAAAGVSGPAIYRHFPNKEALLVELLVGISARLLAGARTVVVEAADAATALERLIDFHLDFALGESDLIRIQDRDLEYLPDPAKRQVRKAQRQYVEIWVDVLLRLDRASDEADARLMAHAVFGLLNSTPHSVRPGAAKSAGRGTISGSRAILRKMTIAALSSAGRSGG
ncbi:SACE_7040 family transcriptional regulator [Mycolicibacterium stellerae]|uniref:SACE_7040 family transcriptional regulator n=1 Tax=Mycolicibacterium stellerae TaxID=2358193 RepID=UPI000F0B8165|nr:TetR/AcrR family transcriptional regulator [Mycolicibacterium stellerae]